MGLFIQRHHPAYSLECLSLMFMPHKKLQAKNSLHVVSCPSICIKGLQYLTWSEGVWWWRGKPIHNWGVPFMALQLHNCDGFKLMSQAKLRPLLGLKWACHGSHLHVLVVCGVKLAYNQTINGCQMIPFRQVMSWYQIECGLVRLSVLRLLACPSCMWG